MNPLSIFGIASLAALLITGSVSAQTTLNVGGDIRLADGWSNGLPSSGNSGTIAVSGILGDSDTFGFGAGSVVTQTAGTLDAVAGTGTGFNMLSGTWNMSGGKMLTRYFLSNGTGAVINLSGGTVELADVTGAQHMGAANGGTLTISGSVVLDGTHATIPPETSAGTINVLSNWSGSWTWGTFSGDDWKNLFTTNASMKVDGGNIDAATFDSTFTVTNNGKTLAMAANGVVARLPSPLDGAFDVPVTTSLNWLAPGAYTPTGYKIYFGTDPDVRANPMTSLTTNSFSPSSALAWSTTYYWVVDSQDGVTTHPGTPWSFTTEPDPSAPYDPLVDLARHNVVWNSPSTNSAGSMPLGNGDLGMNLWVEPDGDLLLLLSKSDAWSDNCRLLKLGKVRISMSPNPFAAGLPFIQTLNLPNGEILIKAGSAGNEVTLRVWADANHPAIHIEAEGTSLRTWQADLELWRTEQRNFVDREELASAYGIINQPTPPVIEPDTVVTGLSDKLTWYHRNVHSIWSDTLSVQSLSHLNGPMSDPLLNRTFGATLYADGFSNASSTQLVSDAPRNSASFTIVAHTDVTPTVADWQAALDTKVATVQTAPIAQRYTEHAAWWRSFWERHWMVVTDTDSGITPASDPFRVTQGYILQRFMQACSGRGGSPIKFNGGLFTVDATSAYDADYRKWGGPYWWQNTRLPYWSMPMAGDFDLMDPLFKMYMDALPLARERVQTYYGHAGAYFPETMYFWGTWNNDNYGWDRTGKELGRSDNNYVRWEWQGGIELVWMMLARYNAAPDAAFASNTLVPMATDIIHLYDLRYSRDPDGQIRLSPAQCLETYWEDTPNPAPEISGLHQILTGLLALPESLTTPALRTQWSRLLGELPPLATHLLNGQTAIAPAESFGASKNFESPELYPIWPYAEYHKGKPNLNLADWTYQNRPGGHRLENGWGQDVIFAAMLGRTSEAKSEVVRRFKTKHTGSRFPAFWGPNYDWIPDNDHGSVNMIALQKMVLQEDNDRILLFPSWPADWDLKFRFHARGNTLVEGELRGGEIVDLKVTPNERYYDVETLVGTVPPADYATWAIKYGLKDDWSPGDALEEDGRPASDVDNDGLSNSLEFIMGEDPTNPMVKNPPTVSEAGDFMFMLSDSAARHAPTGWSVEFDDDLAGEWTTAVDGVNASITITPDATQPWSVVSVTIPRSGDDKIFVRLRSLIE